METCAGAGAGPAAQRGDEGSHLAALAFHPYHPLVCCADNRWGPTLLRHAGRQGLGHPLVLIMCLRLCSAHGCHLQCGGECIKLDVSHNQSNQQTNRSRPPTTSNRPLTNQPTNRRGYIKVCNFQDSTCINAFHVATGERCTVLYCILCAVLRSVTGWWSDEKTC